MEENYTEFVQALKKPGQDIINGLTPDKADAMHMALGLVGEAGELLDAIKKWVIYGKELDLDNVNEELGDLEYFMEGLRLVLNISRELTIQQNIQKLSKRYKEKVYSDEAARSRADKL